MNPTIEQAELLRQELHAWLDRHDLWDGTTWWTADEYYGERHNEFPFYHYFVFAFEGDLRGVMWRRRLDEPGRADNLRDEFDAMLKRHGFWHEKINEATACILGREREKRKNA
jgi:hypothetical protein